MKVAWGEYLSVGVDEIDDQHKLLFEKFNALLAAYDTGRSADEVSRLFSFLGTYVVTHFSDEEQLMQRLGYPDYLKHREMHEEFTGQVAVLKERLLTEGPSQRLANTVNVTITGWLIDHISRMDRAFGRFVKENKR